MTVPSRAVLATTLTVLLLTGAAGALSGCNTVRGAGQDASSVSTDVSNGAMAVHQGLTRP